MTATSRRIAPALALALLVGSLLTLSATSAVTADAATGTATEIAAGGSQGCAITPKERLKCWGANENGQLGIGDDLNDKYAPVLVPKLKKVKKVAVGDYNTCAVLKGGKLKCWGYNQYGAVGDGTFDDRYKPRQVVGLETGVKTVSIGTYHTCALLHSGKAKCWGANDYGEVGNDNLKYFSKPKFVTNLENATQVDAGYYISCATVNGKAKCWGYGGYGSLGTGNTDDQVKPTQVVGLDKNVKKVSAGYFQSCAIVRDRAKCWGANDYGEVGTGTSGNSYDSPQNVLGMDSGVTDIDADYYFTCAVKNAKAKCFGENGYNQLGNGTTDPADVPSQVTGLDKNVVSIDVAWYHACALLKSGAEKCWGYNDNGEVGIDDEVNEQIPTPERVLL